MATIKVKLRPSSIAGKAGTVYYQVTHKRIIRQITTGIHILPEHWNRERQCLRHPEADATLQSRIYGDMSLLRRIVEELDTSGAAYTADTVIQHFREPLRTVTMLTFMKEQIGLLRLCNRLGTAQNYEYTMRRFARFLGGDIPITAVTEPLIERFSASLLQGGMVPPPTNGSM